MNTFTKTFFICFMLSISVLAEEKQLKESITFVNKSGYTIEELHFGQEPNKDFNGFWDDTDYAEWKAEVHKNQLNDNVLESGKSFKIELKYPVVERKRFIYRVYFENGNNYALDDTIPENRVITITKEDAE